jgi:hypothetical protein
LTEEVAVGLKDDICEGKDQAEEHPHIHHLDVGGLGQRVREANKPCGRELYLNKIRIFVNIKSNMQLQPFLNSLLLPWIYKILKTSSHDDHSISWTPLVAALQTILNWCIPDKELAKNSFPKLIYIFPKSFMLVQQELLDAAVSLWRNIIPKGILKQIRCLCPGSNRGSQWCYCEKITRIAHCIQTLAACIRLEYFATGPSELDICNLHKAVLGKIPVGGTDLGSSGWN